MLFVRLAPGGLTLDDALRAQIARARFATNAIAAARAGAHRAGDRHPAHARAARSWSWRCATSCTAGAVRNREALANPDALDLFRDLPELA